MGHKHTEDTKNKIRQAMLGRKWTADKREKMMAIWTPEARERMSRLKKESQSGSGHAWTEEARAKMRRHKKGVPLSEEHRRRLAASRRRGESHPSWKGDEVGYGALHGWVVRQLGKPNNCSDCGRTDNETKYEWANISGEYRRDISDWVRLCIRCHRNRDDVVNKSWAIRSKRREDAG